MPIKIYVVNAPMKGSIYVGRPTCLGNPWKMGSEKDRHEVCDLYDNWLRRKIVEKDKEILSALDKLDTVLRKSGYLILQCHCAPKRCHADSIKKILEERWNVRR
jgi:hypothetical protein